MRDPANRDTRTAVELVSRHMGLVPFNYGWRGNCFRCFLGREEGLTETGYVLRHVYCGVVDIYGVLDPWVVDDVERECRLHYEQLERDRFDDWEKDVYSDS